MLTYTDHKRSEYRALIIIARAWRVSYRQAREQGLDASMARRVANASVFMG